MKKGRLALAVVAMLSSSEVLSGEGCTWDNRPVEVGDSVWVVDPFLVDSMKKRLQKVGLSPEEISREIKHNDWVGYRVECQYSVALNKSPEQKAGVIRMASPVMVLTEISRQHWGAGNGKRQAR